MRILAMDSGKHNFAFAVLDESPHLIGTGHIKFTITSLEQKLMQEQLTKFRRSIVKLVTKSRADEIYIERYLARFKGLNNEVINLSIGTILGLTDTTTCLVTPASWKNYIKRTYGTNDMFHLLRGKSNGWTIHQCDAIGIGLYIVENKLDLAGKGVKLLLRGIKRKQ